ncbi:MAG: tetratricopeptide repeat protein, partial [Thermoanaerobaculia bacterium]
KGCWSDVMRFGARKETPVNRTPIALAAALFVAASPLAFAADKPEKPKAPFEVTVSNPEGVPIGEADLKISCPASVPPFAFEGKTDALGKVAGSFEDFLHPCTVTAAKEGYKPFTQELDFTTQKLKKGDRADIKVSLPPITAAEYYNEGAKAIQTKDFLLAQERMEKAIATDPKLTLAYSALAQVHLAQSEKTWLDQQKAAGKVDAAADLVALAKQHDEAALAMAQQALALDPNDALALNGKYEALGGLGRKEDAEAALAELASKDRTPGTAVLLYNAGAQASNNKQIDVARMHFEEALAINPALYQAHSGLAELAIRDQKFEDAVSELNKVIELSPRNFKAHDRRIEVLKKIGDKTRIAAAEAELAKLKAGA